LQNLEQETILKWTPCKIWNNRRCWVQSTWKPCKPRKERDSEYQGSENRKTVRDILSVRYVIVI